MAGKHGAGGRAASEESALVRDFLDTARFFAAAVHRDHGEFLVELVVWFAALNRSEDPRREFLTRLSAEVTRRDLCHSVLGGVLALADEVASGVTNDQLRSRLVGLRAQLEQGS